MIAEIIVGVLLVMFIIGTHEIGHVLFILLLRAGKIIKFHVSVRGVGIEWQPNENNNIKQLWVTLGGCIANFIVGSLCFAGGLTNLGVFHWGFGLLNLFVVLLILWLGFILLCR